MNTNVQVTEQGLWSSLHPRLISLTVNVIILFIAIIIIIILFIIIVIIVIIVIFVMIVLTGDGLYQRSRRMHLCNHTTSPRSL